jgi:nicotinamidase/pyrazinamidase
VSNGLKDETGPKALKNRPPRPGDALIVIDVQKDFLPGGALAVPEGDQVIPALNRYIQMMEKEGFPVFLTRDWHPPDHGSFHEQGGPWPPHCVTQSEGAQFGQDLIVPASAVIISKGSDSGQDGYSAFETPNLDRQLREAEIRRLLIGGLATDYCVLKTVVDALKLGYEVFLLKKGIRAVDVHPGDGKRAEEDMIRRGAIPIDGAP